MNNLYVTSKNTSQSGQAFVGGIILIIIVLFFCAYFLSISELHFRLFSNSEQAHADTISEASNYANILNEISINNQNIIVALTEVENALLKALEYSIYIGFHQPYWKTNDLLQNDFISSESLDQGSKNIISNIFKSYSLTSARGFYLAKSLAEKNNIIVKKLPVKMQNYFIQSSNAQVLCFALEVEDKYYHTPGIVNLPVPKIYNFYLQREVKNKCAIEHKVSKISKFLQAPLPVLLSAEKNRVIDYSKLDNLLFSQHYSYGVLLVDPKNRNDFLNSLSFLSAPSVIGSDKKFSIIEKFLSHFSFFKDIHLGEEGNFLKSPLRSNFFITHKYLYCPLKSNCLIQEDKFFHSFFTAYWSVTGVYE